MNRFVVVAFLAANTIWGSKASAASPWFSGYLDPTNSYRYYGFSDWDTPLFGNGIQPDSSLLGIGAPSYRVDGHVLLEADGTGFSKVTESTGSYSTREHFTIGSVFPVSYQFSNWWSNPGSPPVSDTRGDFNSQFINIVSGLIVEAHAITINVSGYAPDTNVSTGNDWKTATSTASGWNTSTDFDDSGWSQAIVAGIVLPNTIWHGSWSSTAFFRKVFILPEGSSTGRLYGWFDDDGEVFVNGTQVISDNSGSAGNDYRDVDVTRYLHPGRNLIAARGVDYQGNKLFASTLTVAGASGTQAQAQAGYATLSGANPLTKTGRGILVLNAANTYTGSTSVQAGTLQLAHPSAIAASQLVPLAGGTVTLSPGLQTAVGGLSPNAGGLIDVGSGAITVAAGLAKSDLLSALTTGMGDGSWNGTSGITSSVAAASGGTRTVGWLDNGDGSMVFAFAAAGDTNLDWTVDLVDVVNFVSSSKYGTGEPATWAEGDFNYDGIVDLTDVVDFSSTGLYGAGTYNTSSGSASIEAVPEPSTYPMALAGLACGISMWRRRRA